MKIVDSFIFFNEIEILKIRLELLYDYVDYFIICEANITHSGFSKPYHYLENSAEFSKWADKIIHLKYEPDTSNLDFSKKDIALNPDSAPWKIENGQRNYLTTSLLDLSKPDYLIVSDVDEIWNPRLANFLRTGKIGHQCARLDMMFHYYYLNCRGIGKGNSTWAAPFVSSRSFLSANTNLTNIRTKYALPTIGNAGWHFSYLGGLDKIIKKLESFAHQENNTEGIKDINHIQNCLKLGIDLFGRKDHEWAFHPIGFYPKELQSIIIKYPHLMRTSLLD